MQPETQNYLVKAVVSLLQEARPYGSGIPKNNQKYDIALSILQYVIN